MRSLLSEVDACCLGTKSCKVYKIYKNTFTDFARAFKIDCNIADAVQRDVPGAKSHDFFFGAHGGIYSVNVKSPLFI